MDTQLIECKKIEFLKNAAGQNPFNKEFAEKLATTIKTEGMHHAIVVRPNPEKPGFYIGVSGRHRHYAVTKVLKEQFIEAKVFPDMDEEDAEMARISENLWRNPLTKVQHVAALKRWYELYVRKHGGEKSASQLGGEATKRKAEERAAKDGDSNTSETSASSEEAKEESEAKTLDEKAASNFTEMAAAATGQSARQVQRDTRIAKAFDEDQLEAFEQMKVTKVDMQTIAKIKDKIKRDQVVSLIALGMEPEDALKEVMKDEAPTREDGKSTAGREAAAAAKQENEPALSDDEWFDKWCGDKAKMLGNTDKYKADAILFRSISNNRHTFRSKDKKHVATAKATGFLGPFFNLVNRFISVSHPKDWGICIDCKGTGTGDDGINGQPAKCPKCYGACYVLRTENYL